MYSFNLWVNQRPIDYRKTQPSQPSQTKLSTHTHTHTHTQRPKSIEEHVGSTRVCGLLSLPTLVLSSCIK
ncbi:uncharacterized protein Dwil_GK27140 [Drosophila willistoni]|uniref:Uncharacterized protein n=1 Tax=Drosophila willistoni TaxID=7260 RepID=A0A0Q9X5Y4_DROWI|nr:uncharacterized protein Dwil_GK27140 [Drosophila willistoni]